MDPQKHSRGFTLVETIIYIAIIGGTIGAFVSYSLSVSEARDKTYAVQEVHASLRATVDVISERIRASTGVNTGSSTFDTHPGVLSLVMADAAKNPTIIDLDADGAVRIKEGVAAAINITGPRVTVSNLEFTNLTGGGQRENIRVQMTMDYVSSDTAFAYSKSVQTTVSIRQ